MNEMVPAGEQNVHAVEKRRVRKFRVRCTLEVVVEIDMPEEDHDSDLVRFMIEDNSCPGTGCVGNVIDRAIEDGEERSVCWACNLKGKNEIIEEIPA